MVLPKLFFLNLFLKFIYCLDNTFSKLVITCLKKKKKQKGNTEIQVSV